MGNPVVGCSIAATRGIVLCYLFIIVEYFAYQLLVGAVYVVMNHERRHLLGLQVVMLAWHTNSKSAY